MNCPFTSTRRFRLAATTAALGLAATLGIAAPASAAPTATAPASVGQISAVQVPQVRDDDDHRRHNPDLRLRIDRDGDYRIWGEDYRGGHVRVWLVNVSRDRVVDSWRVRPRHGDFQIWGDDLRCDRTYQAVSYSNRDGRERSNRVYYDCDDHRGGGHGGGGPR